ncbi:MAG TPA: class I SAM-dependent rRNA methyltransferase [Terriglobales bacterium]|jgi:23S rRNA (cytosine1962-C5)-methyltransferase|nr:class I SAM-dependent rRNA methyltransferase [Terriglobales bacterium]
MPKKQAPAKYAEPSIKLSTRGTVRLHARHPWVYRSDIVGANDIPPGALVRVHDERGKFLGTALYSSSSQIAIRMVSHGSVTDLPALVAERIRAAIAHRKSLVENTDAYRLVFSEADFLPGLIIDRYNDVASTQILTQAMDAAPVREAIVRTLREELQPVGIVERVDARIRDLEQLPPRQSGLLWGDKSSTEITMNGVRFYYDGLEGQKTGSFLDQRENYAAATQYAHGEALDAFCYQGGFALHLAARCPSVIGVDSSRPALEMADRNAALNNREVEWIEANAFDLLRDYAAANRRFDTIVLDPPAFAKTKRDLEKALGGYKELNLRAMKMLRPGGILVTCSCSFHVSPHDFLKVVADAAQDAHKSLRVLENRGAAKDHPVLLNVPETSYLQCLILSVSG